MPHFQILSILRSGGTSQPHTSHQKCTMMIGAHENAPRTVGVFGPALEAPPLKGKAADSEMCERFSMYLPVQLSGYLPRPRDLIRGEGRQVLRLLFQRLE